MTDTLAAVPLPVELRRADVLHFLGYRGQGIPSARIAEKLALVFEEARSLVAARGVHRMVRPEQVAGLGLTPTPAACLALGLVTIGPELERQVTSLLSRGETTRALILDAAGSAAAEEAAEALERRMRAWWRTEEGGAAGVASRRFSPGYGRWPLTAQRALFEILPHDEIQVRLLPSCLMAPRKSVSFALWLGPDDGTEIPERCRTRRCSDCDMATCPYREP